jgi:hypothetical protein
VSAQETVVVDASKLSAISAKATKLTEKLREVSTIAAPIAENASRLTRGRSVADLAISSVT